MRKEELIFTKPLLNSKELEERQNNMSSEEKAEYAQLARRIKPVFRCGGYKRVVKSFAEVGRYENISPEDVIDFVDENGTIHIKDEFASQGCFNGKTYCYTYVPSKKGTILDLNKIVNENSSEYQKGFFGYAKAGYAIFDGSYYSTFDTVCKAPKLVKICEISTLHLSPYADTFLPAEAEVLLQIPEVLKNVVNAYELYLPNPEHDQLISNYKTHNYHHKAYARLFRLADGEEEPDKIRKYYDEISIADTIG